MSEKIVVIGSHSFLGSHFIHHALSQGSRVLGLSHTPKKSIPFTPYHWKIGKTHKLSLEQLNPNDHPDKLTSLINDYQPDYVINCAEETLLKIQQQSADAPFLVSAQAVHIYGPGQQVNELIPKIILSILLGKKIPLHNRGQTKKSFIHVYDVVSSIFKTLYEARPGETYHFSTGHSISTAELVTLICNHMNVPFEDAVASVEDHPEKDAVSPPPLDHQKNYCQLDWETTIELEKGINSVITWTEEWLPALKNYSLDIEGLV